MNNKTRFLQNRYVWTFIGTSDRAIATSSLIIGIISFAFNVWVYTNPQPGVFSYYVRDILIVLLFISIVSLLSIKLYVVESKAEKFHQILDGQIEANHKMVAKFRDMFFKIIRTRMFERPVELIDERKKLSHVYSSQVCHSLLADTRELLKSYYETRRYSIVDDLSLTIKLIVDHKYAQKTHDTYNGKNADILSSSGQYIITWFRDPHTWEQFTDRREAKQVVYRVDKNTAFDVIINGKKPKFFSNNLRSMEEKGEYFNQNEKWKLCYNSVLAVPILYNPKNNNQDVLYYGILSVDSKNPKGFDLFSNQVPYNILSHAADLFAIMFGHLEIFENFGIKDT